MNFEEVSRQVEQLAQAFGNERNERMRRRHLDRADFAQLHNAGFTSVSVPVAAGGLWQSVSESTRPICRLLRTLARGDSSVALVSAMHPAVLSYWLTAPAGLANNERWVKQCDAINQSVLAGEWWGTITSEPGSGGDITKSVATATPTDDALNYKVSGAKHFGSGSGVMSYMVTTATVDGEGDADWFFVDMRDVVWDGSQGIALISEWDGHGMTATQSHAFQFDDFPATRIAWFGHLLDVAARAGGFIGCLFSSVIVGIVDVAIMTAESKLDSKSLEPFELVEWTNANKEHWLIEQAWRGIIRAAESAEDSRHEVLLGKTAIAELAESVLTRLCRITGGGTFSRRSPFGHWFEDVRALGFLRPPWTLAYQSLANGLL